MIYAWLKAVHVIAATFFFGAGLALALTKWRADRTGDLRVMAFAMRHIVWADWLFTLPSGLVLPITGIWMASLVGLPWTSGWVGLGILLYAIAGLTWLPAAFLQLRMRAMVEAALRTGAPLDPVYARYSRTWALLGVPAFLAAVFTVFLMVMKRVPFV